MGTADVTIRVEVAARPETVFRFLSDRQKLSAWLGAGADIDPVPGGRVTVRYPDGHVARGRVEEVEPHRRLVFTWGYENGQHGMREGASRVVIELEPVAGGTRVELRHEGLPDEAARTGHRQGWRHYVSVLAAQASHAHFDGLAAEAVAAFVAAWNEREASARMVLLERCFEEAGTFRDAMASLSGRAELVQYIDGTQAFLPGARLLLDGAPDHAHGHVRFPWRFEDAGGAVLGRGQDFGRMTLDGRFVEVVGFWDG